MAYQSIVKSSLILLATILLTVACGKKTDEVQAENTPAPANEIDNEPAFIPEGGGPYQVETTREGDTLSVEVSPTGEFKINTEYPWQLNVTDAPEGTAENLTREGAAVFDERAARFEIDGEAFEPGRDVRAELRFSVCSLDTCLMRTEDLIWDGR